MMLNRSDFNTSYVTVQPARCLGFRTMRKISIHLMLRFNGSRGCLHQSQLHISIHLMLRFNIIRVIKPFLDIPISIHLMLRFNGQASSWL